MLICLTKMFSRTSGVSNCELVQESFHSDSRSFSFVEGLYPERNSCAHLISVIKKGHEMIPHGLAHRQAGPSFSWLFMFCQLEKWGQLAEPWRVQALHPGLSLCLFPVTRAAFLIYFMTWTILGNTRWHSNNPNSTGQLRFVLILDAGITYAWPCLFHIICDMQHAGVQGKIFMF